MPYVRPTILRLPMMKTSLTAVFPLTAFVSCGLMSACGSASPAPLGNAGSWSGTTAQGSPITFSVSPDERVTSISVGYSFNGCTGTKRFSNLDLETAPSVACIPGPCTPPVSSYREFRYSVGPLALGDEASTSVNGQFSSYGRAMGVADFRNYPGCGTATRVTWSAARR